MSSEEFWSVLAPVRPAEREREREGKKKERGKRERERERYLIVLQPKTEAVVEPGQIQRQKGLLARLRGEDGTQRSKCLRLPCLKLGVVFSGCGQGGVDAAVEVKETVEHCGL